MERQYFKLEPSETAVFKVAGQMFAAYVASGQVKQGDEQRFLEKCLELSLALGRKVEDLIQSDDETGHGG